MNAPGEAPSSSPFPNRPKIPAWLFLFGLFLGCGIPILIGSSIYSFFSGNKHLVQEQLCLSNLKAVAAAQAMYSVDNMGCLPPAAWMDATLPYLKENVGAIGCPRARNKAKGEYGFAMNDLVVGKPMVGISNLPLVFDSTLLQRNAVGPTSTLPKPGRHHREDDDAQFSRDGNCIAYVDGSVRWTAKREL